ncbi:MAG: NAD(P)-dependent alcohol dehydrogenase [Acidobacteriaceae bacterium]|nr:NAD(P)-dependent alcohol dehydrogenase [Acidobacteriaceae bacterium]MBV9499023.1 NAD(P)-dependent alcohol dehydrogenase [Acidobacteriaceae bacterium]
MKQFEIQEFGVENLALVERDVPRPGAGEVLVKMRAASLNYRDYMAAKGVYNPRLRRPMIPLSDGAGVVEEIGPGVMQFKKGDRVASCFFQGWQDGPPAKEKLEAALGGGVDGVLREYAVFSQTGLVAVPSSLSDEEAATLPCAALTAWHALFENVAGAPGDSVVIQGTGGVSVFALQFAAAAGLRAIVTSSSDEKLARARQMGASETINYKATPDWEKIARKLTGNEGVDHVIEVGGSETMPHSLRAVRTYGLVSVIGVLSGAEPTVSPVSILMNSVRVQGIYVGSRAMFQRMNRAIEFHRIKPVIDRTFDWTEIKEALRYMETQQHFGKICLRF